MSESCLFVYGITVKGEHPEFESKRYYGVALNSENAWDLMHERAKADGWIVIDIDSLEKFGEVSFTPFKSKESDENESEVEECQR